MVLTRPEAWVRRHGGRVVLVLLVLLWMAQIGRLVWTRWSWEQLGAHWPWAHWAWTPGPWTPGR